MRHQFECDNCGKEIITHCYGPDAHYRRYYVGDKNPAEYLSKTSARLLAPTILLCIECVEK